MVTIIQQAVPIGAEHPLGIPIVDSDLNISRHAMLHHSRAIYKAGDLPGEAPDQKTNFTWRIVRLEAVIRALHIEGIVT